MATTRKVTVKTPLAADKLMIRTATITEQLGEPFDIDVELLSSDESISFDALLGKPLSIGLELQGGGKRIFHGFVAGLAQEGRVGSYVTYRAHVVSWLWFLSRAVNSRIFQKRDMESGDCTVPNILKKVFKDHGFTDIKDTLTATYRPREYVVQYAESDLNFVQRLMQEEGIYYYFAHTEKTHTLVLADAYGAHQTVGGYESVPYYPPSDNDVREHDHINDWHWWRNIQSGRYVTTDYDFTKPRAVLQTQQAQQREIANSSYEVFEYPGKYTTVGEGDHYARVRLEGMQAAYERVRGSGNARGLACGSLFKLKGHPRSDQNREYLIVSATHRLDAGTYESGVSAAPEDCVTTFEAIESKQPYRSPVTAHKTRVTGPQTAMVVGPQGEEVHTDKFGRVKLKFHWDRDPRRDENSSCWVRVSQVWAGKGWGQVSIPRIGQEVVVDFLEGDPDQPLVVGRVFNQDCLPPYTGGIVSGMKSQTHKGSGFNEMSLDDTAGKEKINIHGQYDMATTVQHDQTNTVNNDFTETIKNNASVTVTTGNLTHDVKTGTATYHVQSALVENYDATQATTVKNNIDVTSTAGAIAIKSNAQHIYVDAATSIQLHVGASMIWMDSGGQIKIEGVNVAIKGSANVTIKGGIVHSEADAQHQTKGAIVVSEGSATNTVKGGMVMLNP